MKFPPVWLMLECGFLGVLCLGPHLSRAETVAPVLAVYPTEARLTTAHDRQMLLAQETQIDGITHDRSSECQWKVENEQIARLEGTTIFPVADGQTNVVVTLGAARQVIPVTVERATQSTPVSFRQDVMPILMKAGCNQGSCHGAARGKDGFRLSLFGFDPEGDYYRLTREFPGRRINLALPAESLLLEKASGAVSHSGGGPLKKDDEHYRTLLRWLETGALNDAGAVATVHAVELYPPRAVLNGAGETQTLTVRARYSDGTDRDVTSLAVFISNNDNSAPVSKQGVITAANRGEAFLMARFDTHTVGIPVVVLPKDLQFTWADPPAQNYIDTLLFDKWKKLRINPSDLCTDEEFLRRVSLDITGTLPPSDQWAGFVADPDPDKRRKLVDQLLDRKEFVELWVMKWSELLQIRSTQQVSYKATLLYYNWLQERIANNVPIDQMVRELLSARGGTFSNAATNYYQNETDTLKVTENVAQVFMGMRIQCAQCHNHPFDRWTMDDYYGFAAFFAQIGRKAAEDPRETVVFNSGGGEMAHPVGGRVMAPKFLGGVTPDLAGKDRRELLANWLVSTDNPFFARNLANIVWAHFFGRGIIDEVDDVRVSNPPISEELLVALAQKFHEYGYDFKKLVRDICNSRAYQLSTITNESNAQDEKNFSHGALRRVRAEILLDIISQVTQTNNKFQGLPLGARAVQIADGNTSTYFLTAFGRATRASVCACEVKMEPNLSQALHLLNGETVHAKIQEGGLVPRWLQEQRQTAQIVDEIFVRCLTRHPTEAEMTQLVAMVDAAPDKRVALEDAFWAVLNSREFLFNH